MPDRIRETGSRVTEDRNGQAKDLILDTRVQTKYFYFYVRKFMNFSKACVLKRLDEMSAYALDLQ